MSDKLTKIKDFFQDKTLLFVEDDISVCNEAETLFSNIFNKTIIAKDGIEGLKYFREDTPNVIISDIAMPKLNGLDMIEKIRDRDRKIPIILTTAYDDKPTLKKALNLNITAYIEKPFE
ncbi:MAG: response regulator, partial [Bacteroidales bacterium]|nr:response regulator [Bacteroidales bacterium]